MPSHCESMGPGWSTVNGQCVYSPAYTPTVETPSGEALSPAGSYFDTSELPPSGEFTGTVGSLGFGEDLTGSSLEEYEDYAKYLDPYDFAAEERYTKTAGFDVGQLGTAWDLKSKQLGETWGLKRGELGWGAGLGLGEAKRTGIGAQRKSGMAFSGTAEEMQRLAESNVMGKYEKGLEAGKTAYGQALEAGELGLQQATTDIYQELETDVYDERADWKKDQRTTLNMLLGREIWEDPNKPPPKSPAQIKSECIRGCNKTLFPWICKTSC